MNQHPQHFDKFSLIHDSMNHITMVLFPSLLVVLEWNGGGSISQSLCPILMSDPDLLSSPDKLAKKMDPQTAESMTHTLKLHWSEMKIYYLYY